MAPATAPIGLRVCMIVTNDMTRDARVDRHARTLGEHGYDATVVCEPSAGSPSLEKRQGYRIVRARSKSADWVTTFDQRFGHSVAASSNTQQPRFLGRRKNVSWIFRLILRLFKISFTQLALLREARKTRAEVYCANDLDTLLATVLAAGSDRKVIYDSHELWPDMLVGVPEFLKRILRAYEGLLIRRADSIITVNEFIAHELEGRYHLKSPVRYVYNLSSSSTPTTRRRKTSEVNRRKIALYHGWYSPERGLENLARASEFLESDITLVFRGSGSLEMDLKKLTRDRANVQFEPPVNQEDVVSAASKADAGIVPYLPTNLCNYYASPNKLFEYLEAGLPVAASNLPFMSKFVLENRIGTLFDARDPRSIAKALNEITRPRRLEQYGRNVQIARNKYKWDAESRKLTAIYAGLFKQA